MKENKVRCFIAIDLPKECVKEIQLLQDALKKQDVFIGKFTEPENVHLTLKFFGEIDQEKISKIKDRLQKVCFNKFPLTISTLGVFSEKFIRIIWVKVSGKKVFDLQKKIDISLEGLFPQEQRFMGHITIARVKQVKDKKKLISVLQEMKTKKMECVINKFLLKSSTLTETKAVYHDLATFSGRNL